MYHFFKSEWSLRNFFEPIFGSKYLARVFGSFSGDIKTSEIIWNTSLLLKLNKNCPKGSKSVSPALKKVVELKKYFGLEQISLITHIQRWSCRRNFPSSDTRPNDNFPLCSWIFVKYNKAVWNILGLRLTRRGYKFGTLRFDGRLYDSSNYFPRQGLLGNLLQQSFRPFFTWMRWHQTNLSRVAGSPEQSLEVTWTQNLSIQSRLR